MKSDNLPSEKMMIVIIIILATLITIMCVLCVIGIQKSLDCYDHCSSQSYKIMDNACYCKTSPTRWEVIN